MADKSEVIFVEEKAVSITGGVSGPAKVLNGDVALHSDTQQMSPVGDENDNMLKNYEFPFENLVLEGGGNKGMAYVGALKVLEEAGIAGKIKRVCGASVGAIFASLIAVGFTADELEVFAGADMRKIFTDHRFGYLSLLPNLISGYGWNPGKKLVQWFGEQLLARTGNPDITFKQVLQKYGRELCVVTTNLSLMSTEYFHPKTTPNTPIRTAVRMSMSLPGVFQSVIHNVSADRSDMYVDGGLLCNFPVHAFDGWWLSMDPRDSFFKRLQPLDNYGKLFAKSHRFGAWNSKTLGIMLYSHTETEVMKDELAKRPGNQPPPPPDTKLYRQRSKARLQQQQAQKEHEAVVSAINRFIKELHRHDSDRNGVLSLDELKNVFDSAYEFSSEDKLLLFGSTDFANAFKELDQDKDGEVTFDELIAFVEKRGVNLQSRFIGYARKEINSLGDFIATLQTALSINVKRHYVEVRDIERTIGVDTDYVETTDFELEAEDKEFLKESGARATKAFLRYFCQKHPEHRK